MKGLATQVIILLPFEENGPLIFLSQIFPVLSHSRSWDKELDLNGRKLSYSFFVKLLMNDEIYLYEECMHISLNATFVLNQF